MMASINADDHMQPPRVRLGKWGYHVKAGEFLDIRRDVQALCKKRPGKFLSIVELWERPLISISLLTATYLNPKL